MCGGQRLRPADSAAKEYTVSILNTDPIALLHCDVLEGEICLLPSAQQPCAYCIKSNYMRCCRLAGHDMLMLGLPNIKTKLRHHR